MSSTPFSLRIFVADGDPDGLRLVERSNWIGKALMFPRALYTKVRSREEFKQTGVYLLLGPRTDGEGEMLYIGEGDQSDRGWRVIMPRRTSGLRRCSSSRDQVSSIKRTFNTLKRNLWREPRQQSE